MILAWFLSCLSSMNISISYAAGFANGICCSSITWSLKWQPLQLNVFWGNSYLFYYYQNAKRNFISVALGFDFCDSWQLFRRFVCVAQATSEVFFSWAKLLLVLQFYVISSGLAWFKNFFYLSSQWIFGCWLQFYSKKFSINICD